MNENLLIALIQALPTIALEVAPLVQRTIAAMSETDQAKLRAMFAGADAAADAQHVLDQSA